MYRFIMKMFSFTVIYVNNKLLKSAAMELLTLLTKFVNNSDSYQAIYVNVINQWMTGYIREVWIITVNFSK